MNADFLIYMALTALVLLSVWFIFHSVAYRSAQFTQPDTREAALSVSHNSQTPAAASASGSHGDLVVSVMSSPAGVVPSQSGDSGQLLPFSRAERGYAINFSNKVH